jgi:hypothetical protein
MLREIQVCLNFYRYTFWAASQGGSRAFGAGLGTRVLSGSAFASEQSVPPLTAICIMIRTRVVSNPFDASFVQLVPFPDVSLCSTASHTRVPRSRLARCRCFAPASITWPWRQFENGSRLLIHASCLFPPLSSFAGCVLRPLRQAGRAVTGASHRLFSAV